MEPPPIPVVYSVSPAMKACLAFLAFLLALPAFALSVEDVEKLAKGGLSDEVILAQIQSEKATFSLDADGILALKQAGVSERVIRAMIESRKAEPAQETGRLEMSNDADEPLAVMVHPAARTVFLYHGRMKDGLVVEPGASRVLEMPPGAYVVRWVGEKDAVKAPLHAGGSTRVVATRVTTADLDALHITTFEGERESDAGLVKVFREGKRPEPGPQASYTVPSPVPTAYPVYAAPPPTRREAPLFGRWTLFGAAAGAVIGNQSDSRDKGLALGAALGHVLDHLDP